jgi:hypothetical protein
MSVSVPDGQESIRVSCVSRGLKARRAARYHPRHRLLILAGESGGFALRVRSAMTRQIPDAPVVRCAGCRGTRLIPLTFRGARRTKQSELPVRPNAKCVTCGLRYIGTQPLPRDGALISLAVRDAANRSAPWGRALAEWAVRIDSVKQRPGAETQNPADRTPSLPPGMLAVLVT